MLKTLQIFQIVLFTIPVLILVGMGAYILITPLSFIHRRWFIGVFLPFLLANPLAVIDNQLGEGISLLSDWRFWLILSADLVLIGIIMWFYRHGWIVFGISGNWAANRIAAYFEGQGMHVTLCQDEKRSFFGHYWKAQVIQVSRNVSKENIWIMARAGELRLQVESTTASCLVRKVLPILREGKALSDFRQRAVGVLYIILGLVIAFISWIYFFEPRLILLE